MRPRGSSGIPKARVRTGEGPRGLQKAGTETIGILQGIKRMISRAVGLLLRTNINRLQELHNTNRQALPEHAGQRAVLLDGYKYKV